MSATDPPQGETTKPPEVTASVEGIPPRDQIVTFNQQYASYYAGETAAFTPEEVARLTELGVIGDLPATEAPVNVDVPHVSQLDDVLSCTMGNWSGTPTAYAYAWKLDDVAAGADSASYTVTVDDAGKTATCVVTATNAIGSTAAPPSNALVVTDPGGAATRSTRAKR